MSSKGKFAEIEARVAEKAKKAKPFDTLPVGKAVNMLSEETINKTQEIITKGRAEVADMIEGLFKDIEEIQSPFQRATMKLNVMKFFLKDVSTIATQANEMGKDTSVRRVLDVLDIPVDEVCIVPDDKK